MGKSAGNAVEILYEDEHIAAFDKPAGVPVAPERWDKSAAYFMAAVHRLMSDECRNVHRLDRDTSGVLLCARSKEPFRRLAAMFRSRSVAKTYLAIVRKTPVVPKGLIDVPIRAEERDPGRMRCAKDGRKSETEYEVLERWRNGCALLRIRPKTGRTHQIRVHLAFIASPVLSDPVYGDGQPLLLSALKPGYKPGRGPEKPLMSRSALHAESIAFAHPADGHPLEITAPVPKDLMLALKYLRKYS